MTPFKKIKVLTQAELDAIELAGTQEEGIDYRVKGEINYYKHEVLLTNATGFYKLQALSSDITQILTFSDLIDKKDYLLIGGYQYITGTGYKSLSYLGVSSSNLVLLIDGTQTTVTSSDITNMNDTVVEL